MDKNYICISCPVGCRLTLTVENEENISVSGNKCKRGIEYAKNEYFSPKRVVTATGKLKSNINSRIPVKSDGAVPKEYIDELLQEIYSLEVSVPVKVGDIIISNFRDTGINIVTSRSFDF